MKIAEVKKNLKGQKIDELNKALASEYEKLNKKIIDVYSKKEKNHQLIRQTKKQIARIHTIIRTKLEEENV